MSRVDRESDLEKEAESQAEENARLDAEFLDPPFPYRPASPPDWAVIPSSEL